MPRYLLALLFAFSLVCISGCADAVNSAPGIEVGITNVFPNNVIQAGEAAVTLNAVVVNDKSNSGVKWTLTVANTGCSPECGTLVPSPSPSFSAVYTPPAVAPANQNATITAISAKDHRQIFAFNFTIIPPTSVSITNPFSSAIVAGPGIRLDATVSNDPTNSGLTWTLQAGGAACSPDCGTLAVSDPPSLAALYTPPAVLPTGANANPTITATSVAKPSASDSFSFTISSAAVLLNGSYTFLLRGFDAFTRNPMAMAGVVTADGKGNITGGEIDFNNGGGINHVPSPATGVYSIDNSFNGITHGTIEITSFTFPGSQVDLKFHFTLSADGKRGSIIEIDGSGYLNAGSIGLQDTAALSARPTGNFAFGLNSDAPIAGRTVAVGQLQLGASGVTGGLLDESKAAADFPIYSAEPIQSGEYTAPDSAGRGTLTINLSDLTSQYAYYIVDASHIRLVQIDPGLTTGTVQSGDAYLQKSLTADSVNTTSVLQLTGMDEPSGTSTVGPAALIGVLSVTEGTSFSLTFDSNDVGTVLTSHPAAGSISSFDPATGRAVLSSPGGFGSGFVDSAVLYLYDTGTGFFIDTDPSTPDGTPPDQAMTNYAYSGTLTPQAAGPFSSASISGNALASFGGSAAPEIPNFDLGVNFDNSANTYVAYGDLNSLPSQNGAAVDFQFPGNFSIANTSLGHGRMTLPAAVFGDFTSGATVNASFYLIGTNQFVLIGIDSGRFSGVAFFDPQ